MPSGNNVVSISITVSDVARAVALYVDEWELFDVFNRFGFGSDEVVALRARASAVGLEIVVRRGPYTDASGRLIPSSRTANIQFPKVDFDQWADRKLSRRKLVEETPWSSYVVLTDPFGHMFVVHTPEL